MKVWEIYHLRRSQIAILGLIKIYFNLSYVRKLKLDTFYFPSTRNIRTEVI